MAFEPTNPKLIYQALFEHFSTSILVTDPLSSNAIVYANPAASQFYGYTHEALQNLHFMDLASPPDPESTKSFDHLKNGLAIHLLMLHRLANGITRPVRAEISGHELQGQPFNIVFIYPIPEIQPVEKIPAAREARLELVFENMEEGFALGEILTDETGQVIDLRILDVNQAFERQTGLNSAKIIGQTLLAVIPQTDVRHLKIYGEVALTGKPATFEYASPNLNRYFRVRALCPQPRYVATLFEDITERKQASSKIAFQASMLEQVHNGVIAIDFENKILYWNKYAETLYQWTSAEVVGRNIIDLLSPEELKAEVLQNFESLNRDGHWEGEFNVKRKDGSVLPAHITNTYLLDADGHKIGFIGISEDITSRKQTERELQNSEHILRTLLDTIPGLIWSSLPDGSVDYLNQGWLSYAGLTQAQAQGAGWMVALHPDDVAETKAQWAAAARTGSFFQVEQRLRRADGTYHWFWVQAQPLFDAAGQALKWYGMNTDITARKNAEANLQSAHAVLEQHVQERTVALQNANRDLAKALQSKNEFLAAVSHELRTPLVGILGMAEALSESTYGPLSDRQLKAIGIIEKNGQRLNYLINDILDYTHLQSGDFPMEIVSCSLGDICRSVMRRQEAAAIEKNQIMALTLEPAELYIQADARRVKQLLFHLLSNATKFTPTGGKFGIEVLGSRITQKITITVWDTGIGIQAKDLPKLFQPFTQLDGRLARQYGGTGLGLVIVKALVDLFAWEIQVTSTPGEGSRFTLTLPWHE